MKVQTKKEIKLIDGVFTPSEAKSILVTMIDNKINYHKLDDFSNHIRTDRHPHHSKKRVEELLETKIQLRSWLDLVEHPSLKIKGTITIELDEDIQ
ncbi:hypothetical protein HKT18_06570 [Flavobacterium sp. IMCC34852]|uniref:Uncharacterized protein n=1 Tax=Flavobacterium rivulicola TaxID=2732161 RepID=A0A7Y3R974_9FLAO|nr:hypothetical protein [Flavobacterium sp. IMCC34852]NNT71875.1 hypothetical protein [Flavobacterium sp. IMCC34852]